MAEKSEPRRILAFAYACEPGKGSEPGAGWAWVRMLARVGIVTVITRHNNRRSIESALQDLPDGERITVEYVDLPRRLRAWKRGQRGVRVYYLLWLVVAVARGRELRRSRAFDLVWHLTFANGWFGSLAPLVGGTFVYGPVGGGTSPPWRLVPALGVRGAAYEGVRAIARMGGRYLNPLARLCWSRADLILVQNAETRDWLPRRHRRKAHIFPNAVLETVPEPVRPSDAALPGRTALFAGRLLPLKGVVFAIRALCYAGDWRLVVCGDGPDRARLEQTAERLGVASRVEFAGWITRADVLERMRAADVFLFPSLHDESPLAVVDALSTGLPVVTFPGGGARSLAGKAALVANPRGGAEEAARSLAAKLVDLDAKVTKEDALHRSLDLKVHVRAHTLLQLLESSARVVRE